MKTFRQYVENRITYSGLPQQVPDQIEPSAPFKPYVGLPEPEHVTREKRLQDLRSRRWSLSPEERIELSQLLQDKAVADAPPPPAPPYQRMPESPSYQRSQEIEQLRSLGARKTMEQRIRLAHLLGQKNKEDYDYDNLRSH